MENTPVSSDLIDLLTRANAREMQVSIQYMLQHSVWFASLEGHKPSNKRIRFISRHAAVWMPGNSLRKIAMAEMIHAEKIAERIVRLGGELTPQHDSVSLGKNTEEMLSIDLKEEQSAIDLYEEIITLAEKTKDTITRDMFVKILADEKKHHRLFASLLK